MGGDNLLVRAQGGWRQVGIIGMKETRGGKTAVRNEKMAKQLQYHMYAGGLFVSRSVNLSDSVDGRS